MRVTKLREIHGIGATLEQKLMNAFKTEENALDALRTFDIGELSSIEGFGEKFSLQLCRRLYTQETGEKIKDFLHNNDAKRLFDQIIRIIGEFASTSYSRAKLHFHYPLPANKQEKILERQNYCRSGFKFLDYIDQVDILSDIQKELKNLSPLKEYEQFFDTASRLVITSDKGVLKTLEKKIGDHCDLELIESPETIHEIIESYDEVLWVGSDIYLDDSVPNIINIPDNQISNLLNILPEKILNYFAKNKKTLLAISNLSSLLLKLPESVINEKFANLNIFKLSQLKDILDNLEENGEPRNEANQEYNRISNAFEKFDIILSEVQLELNENLEEKLQETTVKFGGEKLVELLKGFSENEAGFGAENFKSHLDEELSLIIEEELAIAEEKVTKNLSLMDDETEFIEGLFPREIQYPIEALDEVIGRIKDLLRKKRSILSFELKVKLAKELEDYKGLTKTSLSYMYDIDYQIMLAMFTRKYNLKMPKLYFNGETGLILKNSKNLQLKEAHIKGVGSSVDSVSYTVGKLGKSEDEKLSENIVLLSGANSGGKTTLLVAIGYVIILAQMGLPVPCSSAIIGCFDEIHFYRKSTGQLNAGAFESTLKMLSKMLMSDSSKLILADEMESISEPGASARVIGAILSILNSSSSSCGVFVSHLAKEISKYCNVARIDGIEATGLADNLDLLVSRTPRYHYYARSTPELIVQRLRHMATGREKEIYTSILNTFNQS